MGAMDDTGELVRNIPDDPRLAAADGVERALGGAGLGRVGLTALDHATELSPQEPPGAT